MAAPATEVERPNRCNHPLTSVPPVSPRVSALSFGPPAGLPPAPHNRGAIRTVRVFTFLQLARESQKRETRAKVKCKQPKQQSSSTNVATVGRVPPSAVSLLLALLVVSSPSRLPSLFATGAEPFRLGDRRALLRRIVARLGRRGRVYRDFVESWFVVRSYGGTIPTAHSTSGSANDPA